MRGWLRPEFVAFALAAGCSTGSCSPAARASAEAKEAPPAQLEGNPDAPGLAPTKALQTRLREALAAKGPAFASRSRHRNPDGSPRYLNRLLLETSPYLRLSTAYQSEFSDLPTDARCQVADVG